MAAKSRSAGEPEQQVGEERVVDPPSASADETNDPERATEQQWVIIDQSAILTLPSGASYNFNAGNILQLPPEDAAFIIDQGYASETTAPSTEPEIPIPETEAPSEE
jgi:hypothetical protein